LGIKPREIWWQYEYISPSSNCRKNGAYVLMDFIVRQRGRGREMGLTMPWFNIDESRQFTVDRSVGWLGGLLQVEREAGIPSTFRIP
jgi:hypothetical protein